MLLTLTVAAASAVAPTAAPNLLLFLADDLGYGDLGVSGHPTSVTPAIDALASGGLRLTSFYTASPVCSPSRAGIATGRFPGRSGVFCANDTDACGDTGTGGHNGNSSNYQHCCNGVFLPGMPGGMSKSELTIGQLLRPRGYTTMVIGKWHLGIGSTPGSTEFLPTQRGFDHYYGVPHGLGACPCAACFAPDTPCAIGCQPSWAPCPVFSNTTIIAQPANLLTLSDDYGAAASAFVTAASQRSTPWFLWYASHHVHSPQFAGKTCTNSTTRGRFGDSLFQLDTEVAGLMATLRRTAQENTTLTVFTSDNGPSLRNQVRGGSSGLLRCGKGTTFEAGLRVPAIFHWPGHIKPSRISDALATTLDLLPTFVGLSEEGTAGSHAVAANLPVFDGVSIAGFLLRGEPSERTSVIYYPQFAQQSRGVFAVRVGAMKVHFRQQGSMQCVGVRDQICGPETPYSGLLPSPVVYDLDLDPSESWPVTVGSLEYASAVAAATAAMAQHEQEMAWDRQGPQLAWSVGGGWDSRLQPCARSGCEPFPSCCTTAPPSPGLEV